VCFEIRLIRARASSPQRFEPRRPVAMEIVMLKRKDPPLYPGDEAINKAFAETVRSIRIAKGLSIEEADALVATAMRSESPHNATRALGLVVRELREKQRMSRWALGRGSGLSVRLLVQIELGKADPALTDVVRLSIGLRCCFTEVMERIYAVKQKLDAN
jgi:DNA-binding XRE family transcriptional regulator